MYAHKVIESMSNPAIVAAGKEWGANTTALATTIRLAWKFNLGNWGGLWDTGGKSLEGRAAFQHTDIRLPFRCCWFDFDVSSADSSKRGVLAMEVTETRLFVQGFFYVAEYDMWSFSPLGYDIYLGYKEGRANIAPRPLKNCMEDNIKELFREDNIELMSLDIALSLMSCKNIGQLPVHPPEKLNKKRVKRGKEPIHTYHILAIKQPSSQVVAQEAKHLWETRLHITRGHFKEYTEDSPLFGKYTGRYWWQPHTRGNKELGTVAKDYRVVV